MSVFKELIGIWRSKDLLDQAWIETHDMMLLSNEMFDTAIKYLRRGAELKVIKNLKKKDKIINEYQQNVRKKVLTHFSISNSINEFPSGLVLLSIVVDVERLGDYTKNILDLAFHFPKPLVAEKYLDELAKLEQDLQLRFPKTISAIDSEDEKLATELLKSYRSSFASISDKIVNKCISGEHLFGDEKLSAAISLYSRYLKRLGGHLKNITTTILNPYEYIGYRTPK